MKRFNPKTARDLRLKLGLRLIDIAVSANVAPSTVRTYEFGAPVRHDIEERLVEAYRGLTKKKAV